MVKMKMKKLACALAAAAMMFTSAPVFAADNSPVPGDVTITYPTEAEVPGASSDYTVDGVKVEIVKSELSEDAAKDVDTPEKVIDLIQNAGFTVPSGSTVVVTGGEYSAEIDDSKVDVNGHIEMVINMAGTEFAIGQSVFVLHQMKNGEWEVIQTVVNSNGDVVATLNGLSPVVIAKVMTDGTVKPTEPSTTPDTPSTDNKKPTNTATNTSTNKTTSTKTAEKTSPSTAC
ncbi:hypothetical protein [Allobaculum sp. JKK-2023]|uniref:hypothetical protein n=1 Tax=Allobaculum sp. JKK-2023 TaxID=3108943 RepID=UPI002B056EFD|nr:hypothetical protein [Allobaculum sp. JKK-2023]